MIQNDAEWLSEQIGGITQKIERLKPSDMAEKIRVLAPSTTNNPGPFRWDVAPYMREILDCFDPKSGVWMVAVMKGVQVAFTVSVLENVALYYMTEIKTAPVLCVTASEELADKRMQSNIVPMITASGQSHLVQSSDTLSTKKQGKTAKNIEWAGGGWMMSAGATNPNKFCSLPFPCAIGDEVDRWVLTTADGPPLPLLIGRTKTYEDVRKVLLGSTPVDKSTSVIYQEYLAGDQSQYYINCLGCGEAQRIRWERRNEDGVKIGGIFFDLKDGAVVRDSVRYVCHHCGTVHTEGDKQKILFPEYGAEWRPTAKPVDAGRRSFHCPALISTVQTWYACCVDWVDALGPDLDPTRPRDMGKLKVFYNNILGEPFEMVGVRPSVATVLGHRRIDYAMCVVPDRYARRVAVSGIDTLICTVDVHPTKGNLKVAVFGYARGCRAFLVDYITLEGDPNVHNDPGTWGKLSDLLENPYYKTEDGSPRFINFCAIDSGIIPDQVYSFCNQYPDAPIFPIKGKGEPVAGSKMPFAPFKTANSGRGYTVIVDYYKDRWAHALRKSWDDGGIQMPEYFFSAPVNISDDALIELTKEYKRPKKPKPGQIAKVGYEWYRPQQANNELWDLLIYSSAMLDIACYLICTEMLDLEGQDWDAFYEYMSEL